jgi:hypothetical protein
MSNRTPLNALVLLIETIGGGCGCASPQPHSGSLPADQEAMPHSDCIAFAKTNLPLQRIDHLFELTDSDDKNQPLCIPNEATGSEQNHRLAGQLASTPAYAAGHANDTVSAELQIGAGSTAVRSATQVLHIRTYTSDTGMAGAQQQPGIRLKVSATVDSAFVVVGKTNRVTQKARNAGRVADREIHSRTSTPLEDRLPAGYSTMRRNGDALTLTDHLAEVDPCGDPCHRARRRAAANLQIDLDKHFSSNFPATPIHFYAPQIDARSLLYRPTAIATRGTKTFATISASPSSQQTGFSDRTQSNASYSLQIGRLTSLTTKTNLLRSVTVEGRPDLLNRASINLIFSRAW